MTHYTDKHMFPRPRYTIDGNTITADVKLVTDVTSKEADTNEALAFTRTYRPTVSCEYFLNTNPNTRFTIVVELPPVGKADYVKDATGIDGFKLDKYDSPDLSGLTAETILAELDKAIEGRLSSDLNQTAFKMAETLIRASLSDAINDVLKTTDTE